MKKRSILKKGLGIIIVLLAAVFFMYVGIWSNLLLPIFELICLALMGVKVHVFNSIIVIFLKFIAILILTAVLYLVGLVCMSDN